jgi:myosin-crossreactive antigen
MAKYKVVLTVKDSYGNTKELDGGDINIDFTELSHEDINQIEEVLPLENYLKKSEIDYLATDLEVEDVVGEATASTVKYSSFKFRNDSAEGTDKQS